MVNLSSFRHVTRILQNSNVQLQTRRNIYPHYLRYMVVRGRNEISTLEKGIVLTCFYLGILGPATYIMYDVGKKRPDNRKLREN